MEAEGKGKVHCLSFPVLSASWSTLAACRGLPAYRLGSSTQEAGSGEAVKKLAD